MHVVDKATKLQTIFDRVHLLDTRFEVLKRDAEIAMLKGGRSAARSMSPASRRVRSDDRAFLRRANVGGEFMRAEDSERVRAHRPATAGPAPTAGGRRLTEDELKNLTIAPAP